MRHKIQQVIDDRWTIVKKDKIIDNKYGINSVSKTVQPSAVIESSHENLSKDFMHLFADLKPVNRANIQPNLTDEFQIIKYSKNKIINS
ncbi:MAG: hypothetical protein AABW89_05880 [Nanoarchaeota archaeon]